MATVSPHVASLTTIVGRQAELRALRAAFLSDSRVHALTGMGGVGKTSLARGYAQQHLNDYDLIWWIRAEDPAAIDAEFRSLLDVLLPPGQATQINDARTKAFDLLAHHPGPWLLVLDNVTDAAGGISLLPPAGNGHVLITSRAPDWPAARTVQPLGTEAAVELLTTQSNDHDAAAAKVLATELGGLPLALTQAAAFVRTNHISLAAYVRLYHDRSAELLKEGRLPDYPHTVATTWQLAIDQLSDGAREMLNTLAFYAPDAIPVHILFASFDEIDRHRAIGELYSYNLITLTDSSTITMHRLIQAVTRNQLGAELSAHLWAGFARELITEVIPPQTVTAMSLITWNALHTHVLALNDHLSLDDPATLDMRSMQAYWTGRTGDAEGARDLYRELLPIHERLLGIEHPMTLTVRHNMAYWTGQAGDAQRARDLFDELLPIVERALGPNHIDTMINRMELANWTGDAGDPTEARTLITDLLPTMVETLGVDHPNTLTARHNLAAWTGEIGEAESARDMYADLLPTVERVMGPDHPDTLGTWHMWACWTGHAGDVVAARELYTKLLPIREQVQGPENPLTLTTRHSLAYWTGMAGAPDKARDICVDLLPIQERVLGADHPESRTTRQLLALWTELANLMERASNR